MPEVGEASEPAKVKRAKTDMFITTMGLFWQADDVFWGRQKNPGSLLGRSAVRLSSAPVDFREQVGIYVLYADYDMVYVGQTGSGDQRLFVRLRQHRADHLAGRWNRFSWFGTRRVVRDGVLAADKQALHPSMPLALDHIEGVLIAAAEPPLNRQSGSFGASVEQYVQVRDERLGATDRELIDRLCEKMGVSVQCKAEPSKK